MSETRHKVAIRSDRRKGRTRRQLLESAIALVLEKGYEDFMTEEITELADLGRRTFYNHFVSKRECVLAALTGRYAGHAEAMMRSLGERVATGRVQEPDHALVLATMASRMFRRISMDPVTEQLLNHPRILSEAVAESQRDHIVANIAEGMVAGTFNPLIPVESLEPIVAWGFVGLVVNSIPRNSQEADSLVWTQFLLHNLGLSERDTADLLVKIEQT